MGSNLFGSIDRMSASLTYFRDRHVVLSSNVANIDTPGYKPMDLERTFPSSTASAGAGAAATGPGLASAPVERFTVKAVESAGGAVSLNGNAVSLEQELGKIQQNRVRYEATATLISARLALLKYSLEK